MENVVLLPAEIIELICQHASFDTLRQLRCAAKICNSFAERVLFRCVNLKVNKESFAKLHNVSRTPHLQNHVRHLVYDGRLLPWLSLHQRVDILWYESIGLGCEFWDQDELISNPAPLIRDHISDEAYAEAARRFAILYEDQKDLHRDDTELDMLTDIFLHLPRLTSIELETGLLLPRRKVVRKCGQTWTSAMALGFSRIGQGIFLEPCPDRKQRCWQSPNNRADRQGPPMSKFHVKRMIALQRACLSTGRVITDFKAGWLNDLEVDKRIDRWTLQDQKAFCGSLKHIAVHFADWHGSDMDGISGKRIGFLRWAQGLESLDLRGLVVENEWPDKRHLREEDLWKLRFPHLRRLRLGYYYVSGTELRGFLIAHKCTLEEVILEDLVIESFPSSDDPSAEIEREDEDAQQTEDISRSEKSHPPASAEHQLEDQEWVKLFDTLAEELHLRHFELCGRRWNVHPRHEEKKRQIIEFVTGRRKSNPITVKDGVVEFFGHRDRPMPMNQPPWVTDPKTSAGGLLYLYSPSSESSEANTQE